MFSVGDNPPTMKQLMYLGDLLRRVEVDQQQAQKIIERCTTKRVTSHEIQKALRLKKEYDKKKSEEMKMVVESIRASNRRQDEKK